MDYTGQSFGGSAAPISNSVNVNNNWLPNLLNGIKSKQLATDVSERWLRKLAVLEGEFYGDIVQQYRAAFPTAYRYNHEDKPEFVSDWGVKVNVSQTQVDWNRVYGIDIDDSEAQKIVANHGELTDFTLNNIQQGINAANLEELALMAYGLEHSLTSVTDVDQNTAWLELAGEVDSHLGYVRNNAFVKGDDTVVVLTDYITAAKLRALPSLRYVDRLSRERVLNKIVAVPFIPTVYETIADVTVTQNMIDDNALSKDYDVGEKIKKGSIVLDPTHFNPGDIKKVLENTKGDTPNIIVYDKRNAFIGIRPTNFNWTYVEGDIDLYTQKLQRGLVHQHTLNRAMNVSFTNLFKIRAFRFDYK